MINNKPLIEEKEKPQSQESMKSLNVRNLLFGLLIVFSFGSYVFINNAGTDFEVHPNCSAAKVLEDEDAKEVALPEIQIVKKLLEKGKEMLPATRF